MMPRRGGFSSGDLFWWGLVVVMLLVGALAYVS